MSTPLVNEEVPQLPIFSLGLSSLPRDAVRHALETGPAEIVQRLMVHLDTTILKPLLAADSIKDFQERRRSAFQRYVNLVTALAGVMASDVSRTSINELTSRTFDELEDLLREDEWLQSHDAREETLFCLQTLRRVHRLAPEIIERPLRRGSHAEDAQLAREATRFAYWSQLHLDCLLFSVRSQRRPKPELLPTILDGFRLAVTAYACLREALALRESEDDGAVILPSLGWDEEDENLALESTKEREGTLSGL